jgi:hypothetical protein
VPSVVCLYRGKFFGSVGGLLVLHEVCWCHRRFVGAVRDLLVPFR